jgi:hypothetical protein
MMLVIPLLLLVIPLLLLFFKGRLGSKYDYRLAVLETSVVRQIGKGRTMADEKSLPAPPPTSLRALLPGPDAVCCCCCLRYRLSCSKSDWWLIEQALKERTKGARVRSAKQVIQKFVK